MKVRVRILPWLSRLAGAEKEAEANFEFVLTAGATLRQLLEEFVARQPGIGAHVYDRDSGAIKPAVVLILNNRVFELAGGYEAALREEDVITLLPAYSGG